MKRGIVLLIILGVLLTCSVSQNRTKFETASINPMNLTEEQNQYVKEHQLHYLTSGSDRTEDHFAIARLFENPQGKLTLFFNYVQQDTAAAVSRRLYLFDEDRAQRTPCSGFAMQLVEQLQEEYPDMGLEAAFIDKEDEMVQTEGMDIQAAD